MIATTEWTGTITVNLLTISGAPAWRLDIVLRRDLVTFWYGERNLAMIDRDQLRTWISSGTLDDDEPAALGRHDLILTTVQTWIAVTVHDDPPVWITPDATARLRAVL